MIEKLKYFNIHIHNIDKLWFVDVGDDTWGVGGSDT